MDRNDQRKLRGNSSQLLFWKLRRLDHGICIRINACKFTNVSKRSEVRWETAHSVKSGADGGGKCQSWWMIFQVLILLLLFRVCDGHSASKAFHHLSQVAVLKVAEWKLLVVPRPPYAFFFFFLLLFKTKVCRTGDPAGSAISPPWRGERSRRGLCVQWCLPEHLKVGGAGGRFPRRCGCAPLGRGGPGREWFVKVVEAGRVGTWRER